MTSLLTYASVRNPAQSHLDPSTDEPGRSALELWAEGLRGEVGRAVRHALWALATLPVRLATSSRRVVELAGTFIYHGTDAALGTCYRARSILAEYLDGSWIHPEVVEAMGGDLRQLTKGRRHAHHLSVEPGILAQARAAVAALIRSGTFEPPEPDGRGWSSIEVEAHGRAEICRCPWHDDGDPSMLVTRNPDGVTGFGTCMACTDSDGSPLTAFIRWTEGGLAEARLSSRSAASIGLPVPSVLRPLSEMETSSTQREPSERPSELPPATWTTTRGRMIRATHRGRKSAGPSGVERFPRWGVSRSPSASRSLPRLLAWEEMMSSGPSATERAAVSWSTWDAGGREDDPRAFVADRFLHVSRMGATRWRSITLVDETEVWIPVEWGFVESVGWVLVDVDGLEGGEALGDAAVAEAAAAVERMATATPWLSGRICAVRTSKGGVQFSVQVASPRMDAERFYREEREDLRAFGRGCLLELRRAGFRSGHIDESVWRPKALMRLPGWRTTKTGNLYRSRLVWSPIEERMY